MTAGCTRTPTLIPSALLKLNPPQLLRKRAKSDEQRGHGVRGGMDVVARPTGMGHRYCGVLHAGRHGQDQEEDQVSTENVCKWCGQEIFLTNDGWLHQNANTDS